LLVGPGKTQVPVPVPSATEPDEPAGLVAIRQYLEMLARTDTGSNIVTNTIGIIGTRGLSGTGTPAENFTKILNIGNQTQMSWNFANKEADASFMVFYSPSASTGMVMTKLTKSVSNVLFNFSPAVPSGLLLDLVMFR